MAALPSNFSLPAASLSKKQTVSTGSARRGRDLHELRRRSDFGIRKKVQLQIRKLCLERHRATELIALSTQTTRTTVGSSTTKLRVPELMGCDTLTSFGRPVRRPPQMPKMTRLCWNTRADRAITRHRMADRTLRRSGGAADIPTWQY